jgi:hypothetical protein
MLVTIPVALTSEEQAALQTQADAEGVSVDLLVRKAVLQMIRKEPSPPDPGSAQWEKEFEEWLDSLPEIPALPDEAMSRESIYSREDEWR